jgi:hypothetical protein
MRKPVYNTMRVSCSLGADPQIASESSEGGRCLVQLIEFINARCWQPTHVQRCAKALEQTLSLLRTQDFIDRQRDEIDILLQLPKRPHRTSAPPKIISRIIQTRTDLLKIDSQEIPSLSACTAEGLLQAAQKTCEADDVGDHSRTLSLPTGIWIEPARDQGPRSACTAAASRCEPSQTARQRSLDQVGEPVLADHSRSQLV